MRRAALVLVAAMLTTALTPAGFCADSRLRAMTYDSDEVYRLRGFAGYQIDLQFDAGESFVGLGSGDVEGLAFEAQGNHLFIKPKAVNVRTNLTVLTTRRVYHFEYIVSASRTAAVENDVVYALRFQYPKPAAEPPALVPADHESFEVAGQMGNTDYWFCGNDQLQPLSAWDDGIHTHIRFNPRTELPALFVRNDDDSESLLNFSVEHDEIVVHRIARRFVVRRGNLKGCIVNQGYSGTGEVLKTGTVSPAIERATRNPGAP